MELGLYKMVPIIGMFLNGLCFLAGDLLPFSVFFPLPVFPVVVDQLPMNGGG